jgi:polysaccharide biosynthesis/export protein
MIKREPYFLSKYLLVILFFASCASQKDLDKSYSYFNEGIDSTIIVQKEAVIKPHDLLGIQVFSKTLNQEQTTVFNLPNGGVAESAQGYQVTSAGTIEIPMVGTINAAGLKRTQLQNNLTQQISSFVKNPFVIVRFLQININVLGEVRAPGTKTFKTDKITIIDALSSAGDLTDYAKRDDIMVIREEGGVRKFYSMDLRTRDFFQSPGYQLQPNDVVYVNANKNKLRMINENPEVQRRTGLVISGVSLVVTLITLFTTLAK